MSNIQCNYCRLWFDREHNYDTHKCAALPAILTERSVVQFKIASVAAQRQSLQETANMIQRNISMLDRQHIALLIELHNTLPATGDLKK